MEHNEKINDLEKGLYAHEVQCDERWRTCFQRLEDLESGLMRIDSRMMAMGGTIIMFLAGVLVTLLTKIQEKTMPKGKGTYGSTVGRPKKKPKKRGK